MMTAITAVTVLLILATLLPKAVYFQKKDTEEREEGKSVNGEGYRDDTADIAVRHASRMPGKVWDVYKALEQVASLQGFELIGLRDKKTGKEFYK